MTLRYVSRTLVSRAATTTARTTTTFLSSTTRLSLSSSPPTTPLRRFSSEESKGIIGRIRDTWEDRNKKAQQEKYFQQLEKMSSAEKWTLKDFHDELSETLGSWRNKIPGMSGLKQIKVAKQTQKVMEACMEHVGAEATAQDLNNLGRQEKLKISLKSGTSPEELNILIKQFQGMDIMQQVLRRRKLEGKPMPMDEAAMKAAMQQDAQKVLSKTQKREIMKAQKRKRF